MTKAAAILFSFIIATGLGGCGVRGNPEAPPAFTASAAP